MRAISLWQPWASLMAIRAKVYETRHWYNPYRGPLAIHAARKVDPDVIAQVEAGWIDKHAQKLAEYMDQVPATTKTAVFGETKLGILRLPVGCVVALGELKMIDRTQKIAPRISEDEKALGNYDAGRWAWRVDDLVPLIPPIEWKGEQGLFSIPDGVLCQRAPRA